MWMFRKSNKFSCECACLRAIDRLMGQQEVRDATCCCFLRNLIVRNRFDVKHSKQNVQMSTGKAHITQQHIYSCDCIKRKSHFQALLNFMDLAEFDILSCCCSSVFSGRNANFILFSFFTFALECQRREKKKKNFHNFQSINVQSFNCGERFIARWIRRNSCRSFCLWGRQEASRFPL